MQTSASYSFYMHLFVYAFRVAIESVRSYVSRILLEGIGVNVEISHNTDSLLFSFQMSLYFSLLFDNKLSTICPRLVRLGVLVGGRFARKHRSINKTVKNGGESEHSRRWLTKTRLSFVSIRSLFSPFLLFTSFILLLGWKSRVQQENGRYI